MKIKWINQSLKNNKKNDHVSFSRGGGTRGNLHMSPYGDVPLFWVLFGVFPDFWVHFWGAPGFLGTFLGVLPDFWVRFGLFPDF